MSRRSLTIGCIVLVVALSGCLGTLASADAGATTVPSSAYEREGYVAGNATSVPLRVPVGVAGVGGEVSVTNHVAGYSRTTGENETAAFLVVTSPNARVAGISANPLRAVTDPGVVRTGLELASRARTLGNVENVTDLRELSTRDVELLGATAPLTTYAGVVDTEAGSVDVRVHVVAVEHGDDVVLALSVHPATMDERGAVERMLAAAEYRAVGG
ncbi:DUF6517 family protein [Halogeometricum limi]|uniref:Uncharacterized protein n=1 Tax=Halogeometricum limi TaxID=555875 RepID=A0A1I6GY64_9EURY|nr:DUF6517 family protein [Halogeometricum limi]SFR47116.1 hypothetical protein SAMN04488124_1691 [Halogeometricum limi]